MPLFPSAADYQQACIDLASAQRQIALVRATATKTRASVFLQLAAQGENITTCRERSTIEVASFDAETIELQGEIDALTTTLRWYDRARLP